MDFFCFGIYLGLITFFRGFSLIYPQVRCAYLNAPDNIAYNTYLRDVTEQEVINRFTTAEIKVEMTNHNTVNNEMDLDGIVNHLENKVDETMRMAAEGVHV
ncbi:hypothetical protein [Anaerosinus massiliensis]|uniref:hypothetical protein n=1 Tax=Massilibacillus massiliensis TaxID=1806837 RepID=UPI0018FE6D71|nr:hypothetical protein [Massilibacillus massiliensis]